jgi:hypothetical protein
MESSTCKSADCSGQDGQSTRHAERNNGAEKRRRKKHDREHIKKHHRHGKKHSHEKLKHSHEKRRNDKKRRHRGSDSGSSDESSSDDEHTKRSIITGKKIKLTRDNDEASKIEEARREAIRMKMNSGEEFDFAKKGAEVAAAPMSSYERAIQEKLKDKDGLHSMMLAKAEHAKFQLATGAFEPKGAKGGLFPDRGRTAGGY